MPTVMGCLNGLACLAGQVFDLMANRLELLIAFKKMQFTTNSVEVARQAPKALGKYGTKKFGKHCPSPFRGNLPL